MKQGASFIFSALLLSLYAVPLTPASAAQTPGSLIKGTSYRSVYYFGPDAKRYVFPTEKIYRSWYQDFSNVVTISDAELGSIQIGGNVTYRPGVRLVKITTDPRVYAVDRNGTLRWVTTEAVAIALYGQDWAKNVDDIPDAFFTNYTIGEPIYITANFVPQSVRDAAVSIAIDRQPLTASPTVPPASQPAATSTTPQGSSTSPSIVISNVQITPLIQGAHFEWESSVPTRGKIFYRVATGTTRQIDSISGQSTYHIAAINDLVGDTTFSYDIESVSASGDAAHRTGSITTLPPPPGPPTLVFSVSPSNPVIGPSTLTLTWHSTNTVSCVAAGSWSGSKAANGSEQIELPEAPNGGQTLVYELTCTSVPGSLPTTVYRSASVINVRQPITSLTVNGSSDTYTAHYGETLHVEWSIDDSVLPAGYRGNPGLWCRGLGFSTLSLSGSTNIYGIYQPSYDVEVSCRTPNAPEISFSRAVHVIGIFP